MKKTVSYLLVAPLATAALALAQAPTATAPAPAASQPQTATQEAPVPPPSARPVPARADHAMGMATNSPMDRVIDSVLGPLELTPEQAQQVGEIRATWAERTESLRTNVRMKALAFQTVSRSKSAAPADVEAKRADLRTAQAALQEEVGKLDEAIAAALDPARREKFLATRAEMKARSGQPATRPSVGTHPAPDSGR